MGGEAESLTPKTKSKGKSGTVAASTFKGLRKHISNGEVHFHDDANGLKFVWRDSASFRAYWRTFVSTIGRMEDGDKAAFICDISRVKAGKDKAANLVWEKNKIGEIDVYLEEYDEQAIYEHEIRQNDAIDDIDHWVHENC